MFVLSLIIILSNLKQKLVLDYFILMFISQNAFVLLEKKKLHLILLVC